MAKQVTEEEIILINELYLEWGVKKKVAEIVGRTPATITKYLIPNYVSQKKKTSSQIFDTSKIVPAEELKKMTFAEFAEYCLLSEEEWDSMKELQKEVLV